jgi:hypothetical protein
MRSSASTRTPTGNRRSRGGVRRSTRRQPLELRIAIVFQTAVRRITQNGGGCDCTVAVKARTGRLIVGKISEVARHIARLAKVIVKIEARPRFYRGTICGTLTSARA